jgi:hypothetical protein
MKDLVDGSGKTGVPAWLPEPLFFRPLSIDIFLTPRYQKVNDRIVIIRGERHLSPFKNWKFDDGRTGFGSAPVVFKSRAENSGGWRFLGAHAAGATLRLRPPKSPSPKFRLGKEIYSHTRKTHYDAI